MFGIGAFIQGELKLTRKICTYIGANLTYDFRGSSRRECSEGGSTAVYYSESGILTNLGFMPKLRTAENEEQKDAARMTAISDIEFLEMNFNNVEGNPCSDFRWDIAMLAKNYFYSRFSTSVEHEFLGKL